MSLRPANGKLRVAMNGLYLHTGNRLETLAAELAAVVQAPLASPFTPEVILVQSLGMRRWLSLQLAERLGICMHCAFPFPRTFLDETLRRLVPEMAAPDAFAPDLMTWKIHRLLPPLLGRPQFAPVRAYLEDGDALKLYQLASRLAHLFDQYLVYRPAMLLEWERGDAADGDAAWQAALWRGVNAEGQLHFGAALERLKRGQFCADVPLPERVSIFGISSLPPAQMEVFLALAAHCPVHLFLLAPSREFHGDDLTPKQRARRGLEPSGEGHPLLTSLGRLNAQFINGLLDADERAGHRIIDAPETFTEPPAESLLHGLQRDIFLAQNRAATGEDAPGPQAVPPEDDSLQIHVCHSPMREVETLYDQLLALLAKDSGLKPRDILVMTPDIERYAPFIDAVFGCPEDPALRIPYSIADRQPRSDSPAIHAFLSLLELPGKRCTAPEVFALLQSPVFRRKFGFDDDELARIRRWISESGIRWGIDAAHRAALGLPAFAENTWRRGLDRLLLGYAMRGENWTLFEGILPQDDVEGSGAELLGRFAAALELLFNAIETLDRPRPLAEWPPLLRDLVEELFSEAPGEEQMRDERDLRVAIDRLEWIAQEAGPEQEVPFAAMREHFSGLMGEAEQRGGFLTGGVTFCALKPMRSIPARVIWLMGMDDGVFPRRPQPPQFDLMSASPLPGDRSVRDDDRYLFLEALLSARDRLRISHVGRSLVNHDKPPPSVVVSELLDYLEQSCRLENSATARQSLVFEHRLHAFSRSYFEPGGRLFSFSTANCAAAAAVRDGAKGAFLAYPLPEPGAEMRAVELSELLAFFTNPAAFFLRQRLGIRFNDTDETLEESEPLTPDTLLLYKVRNELFDARIAGETRPTENALCARALLPPGSVGSQYYSEQSSAAEALYSMTSRLLGTTVRDAPRLIDLRVGAFTLTGCMDALYNGRLALLRPATLKPKDRLRAWIQHLAWCAACDPAPFPSILAGDGEAIQFAPQSAEPLAVLLEIYWRGLREPLPFFPMSALKFAESQGCKGQPPLERARAVWLGNLRAEGECKDPAFRLCFNGGEAADDPLNATFQDLALAICRPMLDAQTPATAT